MTDIRTYTRSNVPLWATIVARTIQAGDLNKARGLFCSAATQVGEERAIYAAAAAAEPSPGVITVGEGALLFTNPFREGFAWRCGECLAVFRRGGADPHAGANYETLRGATGAARKHASEGHAKQVPVEEVTR